MATPAPLALVTGAAGFIGRRVVAELLQRGWRVRAFVHTTDVHAYTLVPSVTTLAGDVRDGAALSRAVAGVDAIVSLAACKMDEPESEATNVGSAHHLVAAGREHGVRRLINVSTQSAKLARPGVYGRTKRAADEVFHAAGLEVTTLRPSLVYGDDDPGVFGTVQRFVGTLPIIPVCGDGRWRSAPIHVEDVAHAIVDCLGHPSTVGNIYDIGGPELIPFDTLIDTIASQLGARRWKFHVPASVALAGIRVLKALWPRAPVSVSNVLGSTQDTAFDAEPARRDFGLTARPLHAGLPQALGTPETRAQHREARQFARYLLRVELTPLLRDRYLAAVSRLFAPRSDASLAFVRRHPWSLPWIDAAVGVFTPRAQLRQRLLTMAAVLETTPEHAAWFLRPPPGRAGLVLGLACCGLRSAVYILVGACLLGLAHLAPGARARP